MTASERIREAREYADQRGHDVAWMTAEERNRCNSWLSGVVDDGEEGPEGYCVLPAGHAGVHTQIIPISRKG